MNPLQEHNGGTASVYIWENRAAMDEYARSDLFKAVLSHPNFTALTSRDFDVLQGPTAVTRGLPLQRLSAQGQQSS